jgi:hypothetical protein
MRQPNEREFRELVDLVAAARAEGQDPDRVQALCEECWPADAVRRAFRAVRDQDIQDKQPRYVTENRKGCKGGRFAGRVVVWEVQDQPTPHYLYAGDYATLAEAQAAIKRLTTPGPRS